MARLVERGLRESRAVDLEALVVLAGGGCRTLEAGGAAARLILASACACPGATRPAAVELVAPLVHSGVRAHFAGRLWVQGARERAALYWRKHCRAWRVHHLRQGTLSVTHGAPLPA